MAMAPGYHVVHVTRQIRDFFCGEAQSIDMNMDSDHALRGE